MTAECISAAQLLFLFCVIKKNLFFFEGKKCTFGIKCKFDHPGRAKQSNLLVADELRENARHPPTAQKQPSALSSPVPGQSLSLVEDMANKLTLGHESSSVSKKDHKGEHNSAQVKTSHRSSKRGSSRKEKTSQQSSSDHGSVRHSSSPEQLDSGLGSIDSQPMDHSQYGGTYRSQQHTHSGRQQFCPPRSAPCSCCSHPAPSSQPCTAAFQHYSVGPPSIHSSDMMPFSSPPFACYGAYPVGMAAYSQSADFQYRPPSHHHPQQQYWSDPFGAHPQRSQWEPPANPGGGKEREVVRKKLLAIFSANLVDAAMDKFPQLMDPQLLVAEILMLQSQNWSPR